MNATVSESSTVLQSLPTPAVWEGVLPFAAAGLVLVTLLGLGLWLALRLRRQRRPRAPQSPEELESTVQMLIGEEHYERAAEVRLAQGQVESALALYTSAQDLLKVAECHLKLKQPASAAKAYRELGRHAEAAHYFQSAGCWEEAADCLNLVGFEREAAELYERAELLERAAELHAGRGDHENAARLYTRAGLGAQAAEALIAAHGREDPRVMRQAAELLQGAGHRQRAAECWSDAGEPHRAAKLWEEVGEHRRAAELYWSENDWTRAAQAYENAGAYAQARDAHERAGNRMSSAQMSIELGKPLDAARCYYELGSYERAIETLQRVPADAPEARDAGYLLGRIFHEKGLYERASETLREVAPTEPQSKQDLEVLSLLAEALERSGQTSAAIDTLEEILAVDELHADVAARVDRLQDQLLNTSTDGIGLDHDERYELRDEIGRGGMGVVHLAWDCELERPVAIKFLPSGVAQNPEAVEMFRYEARAAAAMNHPNIVRIYDVAVIALQPCIVMEYIQGRTVRQIMKVPGTRKRQPLPSRRVMEIGRDVSHALAFAHASSVVHRDVKPSNILIEADGGVKLMDFGISKVQEAGGAGETQAKGTPQYMPPEQILGREIDGRTDLYALGITMFEMVVGQRPFRGDDVVDQQLSHPLPDPRTFNSAIPDVLVDVIQRACEKDPEDRYASAQAMAEALSLALDTLGD